MMIVVTQPTLYFKPLFDKEIYALFGSVFQNFFLFLIKTNLNNFIKN